MAKQRIQTIEQELNTTRQQVITITQAHETLQAAHEALNLATQAAMTEKTREIRELEGKIHQQNTKQPVDLLDTKDLKPGGFHGRRNENFKPWARKVRAFCNAKSAGMRSAMEWAEEQEHPIHNADAVKNATGFLAAETLDAKLHDFIVQLCGDGALLLVDTRELRGKGFEAWRRLKKRYAPTGGAYDLDALASLTDVSACKDLASLPDALARWERKVEAWERQSSEKFPGNLRDRIFNIPREFPGNI